MNDTNLRTRVRDFWNKESCGDIYATGESERDYYDTHSKARYDLEPYIADFAKFNEGQGKDILEIGIGMGDAWARIWHQIIVQQQILLIATIITGRHCGIFRPQ